MKQNQVSMVNCRSLLERLRFTVDSKGSCGHPNSSRTIKHDRSLVMLKTRKCRRRSQCRLVSFTEESDWRFFFHLKFFQYALFISFLKMELTSQTLTQFKHKTWCIVLNPKYVLRFNVDAMFLIFIKCTILLFSRLCSCFFYFCSKSCQLDYNN